MKKFFILTGSVLAIAGAAHAGAKHDHGYDMYVIADEGADSTVYVVTHAREVAAIEVYDDDKVQWMKDGAALKAIAKAQNLFGPAEAARDKGFEFTVKDDDVKISFPVLFFKHISIHANDDNGARVNITSKNGEGDVFVRADDDGAFITIVDASAKDARDFIDDIDDISKTVRRKMKKEVGLD